MDSSVEPHGIQRGAACAQDQVVRDGGGIVDCQLGSASLAVLNFEGVRERNGLEDRAEFVEAVGVLVEHAEVEIDFGERAELRGSGHWGYGFAG